MGANMAASLALQETGVERRLIVRGDWSAAAMPRIEAELNGLPAHFDCRITCDWSEARNPSIGGAWLLLTHLIDRGCSYLEFRHVGNPPHFLALLQKLTHDRHVAHTRRIEPPTLQGLLGKLGRWAVLQGRYAQSVTAFFGRIVSVLAQAFRRTKALRVSSMARHMYETVITAFPHTSLLNYWFSDISG